MTAPNTPTGDDLARLRERIKRVRSLLTSQRDYCSGARLDPPSWVQSVDDALDDVWRPIATEETP